MSDSQNLDEIQATESSAGQAQRMNRQAIRARAEVSSLLPEAALDERQSRIRESRRKGGPQFEDLSEELERATAVESPEIPPTECAEPPQLE